MSEVVQVPVASSTVPCVEVDGELRVVLRPAVEALGIKYGSAWNRLRRRSWATVFMTKMVARTIRRRIAVFTLTSQNGRKSPKGRQKEGYPLIPCDHE